MAARYVLRADLRDCAWLRSWMDPSGSPEVRGSGGWWWKKSEWHASTLALDASRDALTGVWAPTWESETGSLFSIAAHPDRLRAPTS